MTAFEVFAWLIILAAAFTYITHRLVHVPRAVGLLLGGLFAAIAMTFLGRFFPTASLAIDTKAVLARFDFAEFLLNGVLGFIIFAGALEIDIEELRNRRATVLVLASAGVVISAGLVGGAVYGILRAFGSDVRFAECFLFGALVSPTDPVAVLAIMRDLSVPRRLQVEIAGESLLNDGFGIVLYSLLYSAVVGNARPVGEMIGSGFLEFLREAGGGAALGLIAGGAVFLLLKTVDEPQIEVLMSFGLVSAIVIASTYAGTSAPLGCAVAGLFIARREHEAMKQPTREALATVWSFIDFVLNAMMFLLMGVEAAAVGLPGARAAVAMAVIALLVVALRFPSVWLAGKLVPGEHLSLRFLTALTWSGLRGSVTIALALSMPQTAHHDFLLRAAYAIVLFSMIVQASTIAPLLRRLGLEERRDG
ncbi:MAG TPA: sodium:proton antiporter [Thermoanaerobaculia bacterium]|nr:sodium:proton antiporter [Thermoanaerobaculia bacterium]